MTCKPGRASNEDANKKQCILVKESDTRIRGFYWGPDKFVARAYRSEDGTGRRRASGGEI